ncbi:hypothetical protein C2U34_23035 [Ralstonia solanacearum]|nr:hypothetical protein C2U34_23035 [Ralstonia solanacearum]TYZ42601.1 hypothetical protein C2U35_22885 [Ralstonia solanacearum]
MGRETGKQRPERDGTGQIQAQRPKRNARINAGVAGLKTARSRRSAAQARAPSVRVRGTTAAGASVYVRDGAIEGAAPALPTYDVEI